MRDETPGSRATWGEGRQPAAAKGLASSYLPAIGTGKTGPAVIDLEKQIGICQ
jgi:hypothetical protein